ncbi:hypothetical protein ACP70R_031513 [Stipagrostis hirtigluma subsp. patula]
MLDAVVQRLDFFSTRRLLGVCRSWATAVATNTALPLGSPCLLMSREDGGSEAYRGGDSDDDDDDDKQCWYRLLDRSGQEEHSFPAFIGAMRNRWWVGGKDDWLAIVDRRCKLQLVNPYTFHQVDLPALTTIPDVEIEDAWWILYKGVGYTFSRTIVCKTPSRNGGDDDGRFLVITIIGLDLLAIARGGDERWTVLTNPGDPTLQNFYTDAVMHKGKICAITERGNVYAWDMSAGVCPDAKPEVVRPPHVEPIDLGDRYRWNLAESADGQCLLLTAIRCSSSPGPALRLFERDMDNAVTNPDGGGWRPVASLSDHSLFLGANYPFLARLANRDSSEERELLRPNCVYFTEDDLSNSLWSDPVVEVFDLGADTYKLWNFDSIRQSCIWFRPTLKCYQRSI